MSNVSPLPQVPTQKTFWQRFGDIITWIVAGLLFCLIVTTAVGGVVWICLRLWTSIIDMVGGLG